MARVLIVDDTPANLRLLDVMLRGLELEVTSATSGKEAIRCVEVQEFAVILLDVRMNDMDGYETAAHIRSQEKGKLRVTPIIFITAEYQTDVHVRRGYNVGAVDYLLKPVICEILVAKVRFFIELFDTRQQLHDQQLQEARLNQILRELQFARDIQRSILPVSLNHPGVEVFASLESAREVGGDFYDVSSCHIGADRRLCAVVGDVMGKGLPAAMVMVLTLTVLREATRQSGSPQEILRRANAILHERFKTIPTSNAVTAICISLDVEKRMLYSARAGHEELLLWSRRRGELKALRSAGFALGFFEDGKHEELALEVEAGDKLVLYTDGITEGRNSRREFFTEERLFDLVRRFGNEPVGELGPRILADVRAFQGEHIRDDIALLLVEIL